MHFNCHDGRLLVTIRLDRVGASSNCIFDEGSQSTGDMCLPRVAGAQLEREHERNSQWLQNR